MGSHPVNLGIRFILELAAFFSPGYWAWKTLNDWYRYPLVILLPLLVMTVWGVFAVPDDPGRSGKTVIATPGIVRLLIELSIFASGSLVIYLSGHTVFALIYSGIVLVHYSFSYDRVKWLLDQ
ncbi:MAG: YrdB family protein [Bacteroidales bacterium]|jgi:hypothetical protein